MLSYIIKYRAATNKQINAIPPPVTAPKTIFCVSFSAMKKHLVNIK